MKLGFADVVIVTFPFTSASGFKQRPAVVVSSRTYNEGGEDVILLPITSRILGGDAVELVLRDWRATGLLKPSAVKPNPGTFLQAHVVRRIGGLSNYDAKSLRAFVTSLFG